MVKARVFKLKKYFEGFPKSTDLELVEEELPALKDGDALIQAIYISVDPYMRAYNKRLPIGSTYIGIQVAKIIESKNQSLPVGQYVVGSYGWRTHTIINGLKKDGGVPEYLWNKYTDLPISYALGVLGMPGNSAYFGFLEICQPKAGETVVVSSAAGAVGSTVGQIAKIKGCTVIGITGSDEKGQVLIKELGFDHYINYKTQNLDEELTKLAPKGVDCYFDNVSGETSFIVMKHMNLYGRISVSGCISAYNDVTPPKMSNIQYPLLMNQMKMEGWMVYRWSERWMEGIDQLYKWVKEGKIKVKETTIEGFDNMFEAFTSIFEGKNMGKPVVKV